MDNQSKSQYRTTDHKSGISCLTFQCHSKVRSRDTIYCATFPSKPTPHEYFYPLSQLQCPQASVSSTNLLLKSGRTNTGASIKACLRTSKDCFGLSTQMVLLSLTSSWEVWSPNYVYTGWVTSWPEPCGAQKKSEEKGFVHHSQPKDRNESCSHRMRLDPASELFIPKLTRSKVETGAFPPSTGIQLFSSVSKGAFNEIGSCTISPVGGAGYAC